LRHFNKLLLHHCNTQSVKLIYLMRGINKSVSIYIKSVNISEERNHTNMQRRQRIIGVKSGDFCKNSIHPVKIDEIPHSSLEILAH
jgi:hypothetical protein